MTSENSFPRSTCSSSSVVSSQLGSQSEEPILAEKSIGQKTVRRPFDDLSIKPLTTPASASTSPRSWLDHVHAQASTSEVDRSGGNTLLPTSPSGGNGCSRHPWSECTHRTNTEEQRTCLRAAIVCYHQDKDGLYVVVTKKRTSEASTEYYLPGEFATNDGRKDPMHTAIKNFTNTTGIQLLDCSAIATLLARPGDVVRGGQALLRGPLCEHEDKTKTKNKRTKYYSAVKLGSPLTLKATEQYVWMEMSEAAHTLEEKSDLIALLILAIREMTMALIQAKATNISAFDLAHIISVQIGAFNSVQRLL